MTLHQLRIFLAVAEFKSFTQGGLSLRMSQPDVSLHVRNLETEIGLSLFDRVGKKVYLTQAGEILKENANLIFSQVRDTEQALAEIKGLLSGSLFIGASTTVGLYLLASPIAAFKQRYPGIKVQLKMANTGPIERMVIDMEVDVGFTIGTPVPEVSCKLFVEDEIVLLLPKTHPLSTKKMIHPKDLTNEQFVVRGPGSITRRAFDILFSKLETHPPISMELDSIQSIKWAVAEGYGVSLIPKHAAIGKGQSPLLCIKSLMGFEFPCPVYVIWNRHRRLSPAIRAFMLQASAERSPPDKKE